MYWGFSLASWDCDLISPEDSTVSNIKIDHSYSNHGMPTQSYSVTLQWSTLIIRHTRTQNSPPKILYSKPWDANKHAWPINDQWKLQTYFLKGKYIHDAVSFQLFLSVQLTIIPHWFRHWLSRHSAWTMSGRCLNQWQWKSVTPNDCISQGRCWSFWYLFHMGQVTKVWLSCYLVLLSVDSKTR